MTYEVRRIERRADEARCFVEGPMVDGFKPWILVSGLKASMDDDALAELAIRKVKEMRGES